MVSTTLTNRIYFFSFLNANVTKKIFEKFTDINFGEGSKFGTGSKQFSI